MNWLTWLITETWRQIQHQRRHARTGPRLSNAAVRRERRR